MCGDGQGDVRAPGVQEPREVLHLMCLVTKRLGAGIAGRHRGGATGKLVKIKPSLGCSALVSLPPLGDPPQAEPISLR